jgi:hypothetical protein
MEGTTGQDIHDSVEFLAKKLFVPAALNKLKAEAEKRDMQWSHEDASISRMVGVAKKQILSQMKIKELFDLSDRYHRNLARYEDRLEVTSTAQKWQPLIGDLELTDGVVARELTSSGQLKRQGRKENHCVGGYVGSVLRGSSGYGGEALKIFSIEKDGEILSTVEIRTNTATKEVKVPDSDEKETVPFLASRVHQNRARGNGTPPDAAIKAAEEIADRINELSVDKFQTYERGLQLVKREQERQNSVSPHVLSCGYNPWDRPSLEQAWDELSAALPRSVRKKGLDGLISSSSIDGQKMGIVLGEDKVNLWDQVDEKGVPLPKGELKAACDDIDEDDFDDLDNADREAHMDW